MSLLIRWGCAAIRHFRKKAVLFRIFSVLCGSLLLLGIICSLQVFHSAAAEITDEEDSENTGTLSSIGVKLDEEISNLHEDLVQLSKTNSVATSVFRTSPNQGILDDVKMELGSFTENSAAVQKSILYLKTVNYVVASDYTCMELVHSPYATMIGDYQSNGIGGLASYTDGYGGYSSSFFTYDGNLYLARDFPLHGSSSLATIFFEINSSRLYSLAASSLEKAAGHLYVYDASFHPLFASQIIYSEELLELITNRELKDGGSFNYGSYRIYTSDSSEFGLLLTMVTENISEQNYAGFLSEHLVFHIVLLISILALSAFCSLLIYYQIIQFIEQTGLSPDLISASTANNELEFVSSAFSESRTAAERYSGFIRRFSAPLLSQEILDLFTGEQHDEQEVENLLKIAKPEFPVIGLFQVLYFESLPLAANESNGKKYSKLVREVSKKSNLLTCAVIIDYCHFAVILHSSSESIVALKKESGDFIDALKAVLSANDMDCTYAEGDAVHSFLDIGLSFAQAKDRLNRADNEDSQRIGAPKLQKLQLLQVPAMNESTDAIKQPEESNLPFEHDSPFHDLPSQQEYHERIQWAVSLAQKMDFSNAEKILARMVERIYSAEISENEKKIAGSLLLSEAATVISCLENINFITKPTDLFDFNPDGETDSKELLLSKCAGIMRQLSKAIQKNQMPLVQSVLRFLDENYGDPNLSLSMVADKLNVNMSYLSHQFKQSTGANFSDYLNRLRIEKTIESLSNTDIPVKEIAEQAGFCSIQNYIRVFKKYTGKTPGQYRKSTE